MTNLKYKLKFIMLTSTHCEIHFKHHMPIILGVRYSDQNLTSAKLDNINKHTA